MKTLLALSLLLVPTLCWADEGAIAAAKLHLSSNLKGDHQQLRKTYAPRVTLMPGHEFLKEVYGLAGPGGRAKGADVAREELVAAIEKASADRPARPAERVVKLLETLQYEALKTEEGDFATESTDPVRTPDGKLHFSIKDGDVLVKISPPKGDFLLLHLRKNAGGWEVVSEYID